MIILVYIWETCDKFVGGAINRTDVMFMNIVGCFLCQPRIKIVIGQLTLSRGCKCFKVCVKNEKVVFWPHGSQL